MKNKKILILGMAKSGTAAARLLSKYENDITITDIKEQDKEEVTSLEKLGIKVIIKENQEELVDKSFDYIIKNPAIKRDNKAVVKAKELNIPVINEVETAFKFLPKNVKIITITGSNGKTTTTTLVYDLLKSLGNVHLAGNIGIPLSSIVLNIKENDILVMEISDHQLCDMYDFKSNISVITNLSQVHLDFHGSYEQYKKIKKRIFNNHTSSDYAILNQDDLDVLNLTEDIPSKKIYFSSHKKADTYLENEKIIYQDEEIISTKDIKLKGTHNYENIMVAITIAKMFNISNDEIKNYLQNFGGVEHRLEYVKTLNERKFYNDSKATNNKSTIIALDSFSEPTILIMGGLDRNIPFDEIGPHLKNVKSIVCYGETKEKIKEFGQSFNVETIICNNLEEAVKEAYKKSTVGDIILLSPACASWDQFKTFEERGECFKNIINTLE